MEKKIKCLRRKCTVCGESIRIKVYPDKHHHPHYYYGKIKLPIKGTGEYKEIETTKIGRHKIKVVKWTGKEKEVEDWECNDCYEEAMHEDWLEQLLEKLYGKKCKEYEKGCACCQAWSVYETIILHNRGKL